MSENTKFEDSKVEKRKIVIKGWYILSNLLQQEMFICDTIQGLGVMAKQRKKRDLPQKNCLQCGRAFAWRKKWEKVWDAVKYCSDRCRQDAKKNSGNRKNLE